MSQFKVATIDDGGLLIFAMNEQVDEHGVLELEPWAHMSGEIGEKVHDLGVVVLFADDRGDEALCIQGDGSSA